MDSERLKRVNQLWDSIYNDFEKHNLELKVLNCKSEDTAKSIVSDFEKSDYVNYFIVKKNPVYNKVSIGRNHINFPPKFSEGGKIVMIADFQIKNIKKALSLGYDKLVEGMISRNRKGVMLINDNYEVMGTYDIGQKEAIQKIINEQKQNKMNKRPEWLFVGTYPNALMFADKRKEKGGDYHEIGRIVFSPFEIKIYDESSKYSEVHKIMQEEFDKIEKEGSVQVSSTGQRVNIKKYAEGGDIDYIEKTKLVDYIMEDVMSKNPNLDRGKYKTIINLNLGKVKNHKWGSGYFLQTLGETILKDRDKSINTTNFFNVETEIAVNKYETGNKDDWYNSTRELALLKKQPISNKFENGGDIDFECVFEAQTKGGKHALKIYKDNNGTYHREELTNNNIRSSVTYPNKEAAELGINQEIDGALKLDNIAYGVTKNDENFNILKVNKSESLIPIARLKYLLGHNLTEEEKVIVRGQEIAVKALKNDIKATGIDTEEFGDEITKATKHAYPEPEVEMAYEILKQNKFASGGEILSRFIPEEELMAKLKGQTILDYAIGEDEPSYTRIERAYITPKHFDKREVVLETARNFEVRFPLEKLPKFLNLEEVVLKGDKFIHAIQLSQFLKDIYKKNRVVKVNYDNGDSITTEMSGTLTDSEIRDYYKVGRSFNIGSGEHDKMAKVKSVEILYADGGKIEENPTVIIISSSAPLSSQLSELTGKSWNDIDFNSEGDYLSSREFYEVETGKKFKAYTVSEAKELGASGIMIPSLGAIHSVYQMIKEEGDNAAVAYYVGKNFLTEKAMSSILGGYATGMSPEEIHKLIASLAKRKKFEKGGVIEDAWTREKINDFLISAGQDEVDFRDDDSLAGRSNGTYGLVVFDIDDKEKTLYLNFKNSKESKMAYGELVASLSNAYLFSSRFDLMPTTIMVQLEGEDIIYKDGGHLPLKDNFKKGYKSFAKELFESDAYYGKAQLEKDLEEYKTLLYGLEKGKISPETVVGSGFENPKEYAKNFLTKKINSINYILDTKGLGSPVIISEFKRAINLSLAKNSISKDEHVELLDSLYETTSSLPAKYKKGGAIGDIDEETVIIPEIVAQRTAEDVVYKIFENQLKGWSDLEEADKKYLDKKISKKTNEVAKYLVERANTIYKHNPDFRKKINGEKGLEYLYMFMAHWSGMNNGKQTSSIDKIIEKWNKSKK